MNSASARDTAREMGTSAPRVLRAARELGIKPGPRGTASRFTPAQTRRLREHLGVDAHVEGLTTTQARALAALVRAPRGLPSARTLALRAGISPTAASKAVRHLSEKGLVVAEQTALPGRRARQGTLLHANRHAPGFVALATQLARVRPPAAKEPAPRDLRVPDRLGHLFWNTAPSQMDVQRAGDYIARRLITTGDLDGLAWGATHLSAADWESAAQARGLAPAARSMARNIAKAATR
jgi:hypothetical protein